MLLNIYIYIAEATPADYADCSVVCFDDACSLNVLMYTPLYAHICALLCIGVAYARYSV
jgi:hypothetical protein